MEYDKIGRAIRVCRVIRDAVREDAAALTALMLASSAYSGDYRAIIASYPVTPAMIDAGGLRVAAEGGAVLGFYRLDVPASELDLMFVGDAAQGSGLGRALFADMVARARASGLSAVKIVAHPPAADFYRRMGAVDCGVVPPAGTATWSRPLLSLRLP